MENSFHTLITIDGVAREVTIQEAADGSVTLEVGNKRMTLSRGKARSSAKAQRIILDGDVLEFGVERRQDGYDIVIDGTLYETNVSDPRAAHYAGLVKAPAAASRELIKAPMPGMVVSVLVKAGDVVAKGQTVVTLNAMKLENDIRAAKGGVVQEVFVGPDTAVDKGDSLVLIAPEAAS